MLNLIMFIGSGLLNKWECLLSLSVEEEWRCLSLNFSCYKIEFCCFFEENGICKYGDKC